VTKLQTALALSPEQVAALPPPTLRIRQLEQENSKLLRENDELRRQLHMQTRRPSLMTDPHFDIARRGSFQSTISSDYPDRDIKRRRLSQNVDGVYLVRENRPSLLFFLPPLDSRAGAGRCDLIGARVLYPTDRVFSYFLLPVLTNEQ